MKRILHYIIKNGVLPILFAGTIFISLFSCCNNPIEEEDVKTRNILFYIGADKSDIDSDASVKINQIRAGWVPGCGEMIIYIDRREQGACLLRINEIKDAQGYYGLDTLEIYNQENSADSEVLKRVINNTVRDFQADSYGMIFFSHASGWLPEGALNSPRSMVIDENNGGGNREMEYYDFAAAIPDKQFDFIIFEACLMADVMSMYELRNKTEYVLASSAEIVAPGFANIYAKNVMNLFNTRSSIKDILVGFGQAYYDIRSSVHNSITLSLLNVSEMDNLASVTKSVLKGKSIDNINLIVDSIQIFDRPRALGGRPYSRYFDFAQTIENLVTDSDYKVFSGQLEKTVIWEVSTEQFLPNQSGFTIKRHSGLTTYIRQGIYSELIDPAFVNSSWYKAIK
jgi:Clostripain family.